MSHATEKPVHFTLTLSPAEHRMVKAAAKADGARATTEWIRRLILPAARLVLGAAR